MKEKSKFKISASKLVYDCAVLLIELNKSQVIKDDIWTNPLQYFFSPDVDRDANGMPIDDDDDDDDDDGR